MLGKHLVQSLAYGKPSINGRIMKMLMILVIIVITIGESSR